MKRWAVLFPGQGSQSVGMGRVFYEEFAAAREVFDEANEVLGYDLREIIFNGPDEQLRDTEVQQPAILVTSVAVWRALLSVRPDFVPVVGMGLSLGEYSAYVAAGVFSLAQAVRVTRIRGRAMQEAVPKGMGGMVAVLGLDASVVDDICQRAGEVGFVQPANYNAPGQIVVSGVIAGLQAVEELVPDVGGRTVRLSVTAPFHSELLVPAGAVLAKALGDMNLETARFPVVANVDMNFCTEEKEVIPRLIDQVSRPVLFEQSLRKVMAEMQVDGMLELGPGRSLASLVKKVDRRQTVISVENPMGLAKALELL